MSEYKIRYFSEADGCTYCWDEEKRNWIKICPVDQLPPAIKERVLKDKLEARVLLGVEV